MFCARCCYSSGQKEHDETLKVDSVERSVGSTIAVPYVPHKFRYGVSFVPQKLAMQERCASTEYRHLTHLAPKVETPKHDDKAMLKVLDKLPDYIKGVG